LANEGQKIFLKIISPPPLTSVYIDVESERDKNKAPQNKITKKPATRTHLQNPGKHITVIEKR